MDILYEDLENYNYVNLEEELKNENRDLKLKLQEIELAYNKLQKDFDKVSSEYKKLQVNFSSLLKTAKAEIDRKTQAIAALNKEKDMLVLNSIQNRHNILVKHLSAKKPINDQINTVTTNKIEVQEIKRIELERSRNDENRQPSVESASSGNADNVNKIITFENKNKNDVCIKINESTEISSKAKRALSLKHRRKSMPLLGNQHPKCSTDEEYDNNCSIEETMRREKPIREDKNRKYFERHKQSHKISETSGIDEKYSSYHESSRETYYKSKLHRQSDKYRSKDRYRHKRHFSPETNRRARDYHEDHRKEFKRHRVLISPPKSSYDPLRMVHKRRLYEKCRDSSNEENLHRDRDFYMQNEDYSSERKSRKSNWYNERRQRSVSQENLNEQKLGPYEDRQRYGSQDDRFKKRDVSQQEQLVQRGVSEEEILLHKDTPRQDKYEYSDDSLERRSKRHLVKDNSPNDFNEPCIKRARKNSDSKLAKHLNKRQEKMLNTVEVSSLAASENFQQNSCQSPDHIHANGDSTQPKVIMTTSSTCVEDPRLKSEKYVKEIEENKVVLRTITGRNIDLVPIDKSSWKIESAVEVPEALRLPPSSTTKTVQDLHMDVENPVSNMSIESGEIRCESNDTQMAEYVRKNFYQDYENERVNLMDAERRQVASALHNRDPRKRNQVESADPIKSNLISEKAPQDERRLPPVKYKIPRFTEPASAISITNPLEVLFKQCQVVCETTSKPHTKLDIDKIFESKNIQGDTKDKETKPKKMRQLRERKQKPTEIVEKDPVLSDETSDTVSTRKRKNHKTLSKKHKTEESVKVQVLASNESSQKDSAKVEVPNEMEEEVLQTDKKINSKVESIRDTKMQTLDKVSEIESNVKTNNEAKKKSTSKPKTTLLTLNENALDVPDIIQKKSKPKNNKLPKETCRDNKQPMFLDLFGDSGSLITPEDLGMISKQEEEDTTNRYVPIFEDAQDSVDVNVTAGRGKQMQETIINTTITKVAETTAVVEQTTQSIVCKINLPLTSPILTESTHKQVTTATQEIPHVPEVSNIIVSKESVEVKTMVISTGIQPELDNRKLSNDNATGVEKNVDENPIADFGQVPVVPLALATSTPHKRLLQQLETEVASISNSSDTQRDNPSSVKQSSSSNGLSSETQKDDIPDVRIFVKRRRRLKK